MLPLGFGWHYGIFGRLAELELHGRFGLNFDRLSCDGLSVIAHSLGYESESVFRKTFRRVMGYSPRQYTRSAGQHRGHAHLRKWAEGNWHRAYLQSAW